MWPLQKYSIALTLVISALMFVSCRKDEKITVFTLQLPQITATPSATQTPMPTPTWRNIEVSDESLLKSAIKRVYPVCPPQVSCSCKVKVRIAIQADEGIVTEAIAQDVHPLLRESVETAARAWRYKPTMDMDFVLVRGNLVFDLGATDKTK